MQKANRMIDMSGQKLFRLAIGAAFIAEVPKGEFSQSAAKIWGDGVNDDAKGLSALLRGDPVEFICDVPQDVGWRGDTVDFGAVNFSLLSPIRIGNQMAGKTIIVGNFDVQGRFAFDASSLKSGGVRFEGPNAVSVRVV